MSIYQRGRIWWIDYYYKGRRLREPASESKQEAINALTARKGDIVKGRFDLKQKIRDWRFEEFSVEFLEHRKSGRRWWKSDICRMRTLIRYFGGFFLADITPFDVEKFKVERRKSVSGPSVNRELALLKSMFNAARQWGFVRIENPVRGVRYYPERQKERILTEDEARRLIAAGGKTVKPVIVLALNTGMRKSEILDLRWDNVDFKRRFIRVERSKNNRSRKIPMNSAVFEELQKLRGNGSEHVFTKERSSERLRCVRSAFESACRRAEIQNLRFHDLRHTFATNLVMSGVDLVTVKEILGHSTIEMTVRYSHPSDLRKMAAVEQLVLKHDEHEVTDGHNLVTVPAKTGEKEQASRALTH